MTLTGSVRLRLQFLGTGTSFGVPQIGCDCEVCRSDDPRDKRLRSSLWVRGEAVSIVIDTTPLEDIGLNYVLQSDYVSVTDYSTIGINQYLMYFPWEEVGVGGRFEWWKAQYAGVGGASYYQATIGTHLKPLPNIIIRPELRWQWSPAADGNPERNVAGLPVYDSDVIFGMDFIVTF